jgi:hypothetical protein
MSNHHQELADQVVTAFRGHLDSAEQERIGEARFRELHQLVCEALSVERQTITDRVQGLLRELRREIEKPELEL